MEKFNKALISKILSVIVIIALLNTTILSAYPDSNTSHLRVPMAGQSLEAQERIRKAMEVLKGLKRERELSKDEVNAILEAHKEKELLHKARRLKKGGFNKEERKAFIENYVVGTKVAEIPLAPLIGLLKELAKKDYDNSYYYELMSDPDRLADMVKEFTGKSERLDTVIFFQSAYKSQAVIELIANAIDAVMAENGVILIGRFGIGSFQSLAELEEEGDAVSWTTSKDGRTALRITVRRGRDQNDYSYQSEIITQGVRKGTSVNVHKAQYREDKQASLKEYIQEKLHLNYRCPIYMNGVLINPLEEVHFINGDRLNYLSSVPVNINVDEHGYRVDDPGIGMDFKDVHTKLLIPRRGKHIPEVELTDEEIASQVKVFYVPQDSIQGIDQSVSSSVHLQVAGVNIESFQMNGYVLPKDLVIELPASTDLTEDRQHIQLSPQTIRAIEIAIEKVVRKPVSHQVDIINGIAFMLENFTKRDERAKDLLQYTNNLMTEWRIQQDQDTTTTRIYLPNKGPFFDLQLPQDAEAVYINNSIMPFDPQDVPGAIPADRWQSGTHSLWALPLKEDSNLVSFELGNMIIVNRAYYERHRQNPAVLDLEINPIVTAYEAQGFETEPKGHLLPPVATTERKPIIVKKDEAPGSLPADIEQKLQSLTMLDESILELLTERIRDVLEQSDSVDYIITFLERLERFYIGFPDDRRAITDFIYGLRGKPAKDLRRIKSIRKLDKASLNRPQDVATLPDGRLAIICQFFRSISIIDPKTGIEEKRIENIELSGTLSIAVIDGKLAAVGLGSDVISIIDPETRKEVKRIENVGLAGPSGIAVIDDKLAVTNLSDDSISIIDPETEEEKKIKENVELNSPTSIAVIDGKLAVSTIIGGSLIHIINPETEKEERKIENVGGSITVIDGKLAVANWIDSSIRIIDPKTGKEIRKIDYVELDVPAMKLIDPTTGKEKNIESNNLGGIALVNGALAVISWHDKSLRIIEFEDVEPELPKDYTKIKPMDRFEKLNLRQPALCTLRSDGTLAIVDVADKAVLIINPITGEEVKKIKLVGLIFPVGIAEVGGNLAISDMQYSTISIIDPETEEEIKKISHPELYRPGDMLVLEGNLVIVNGDGSLIIINPETEEMIEKLEHLGLNNPGAITAIDGKLAIENFGDCSVIIVDPNRGEVVEKIDYAVKVAEGDVYRTIKLGLAAIDGMLAIANEDDNSISIRDPVTWREVARLENIELEGLTDMVVMDDKLVISRYMSGNNSVTVIEFEDVSPELPKDYTRIKSIEHFGQAVSFEYPTRIETLPGGRLAIYDIIRDELGYSTRISIIDSVTGEVVNKIDDVIGEITKPTQPLVVDITALGDNLAISIPHLKKVIIVNPITGETVNELSFDQIVSIEEITVVDSPLGDMLAILAKSRERLLIASPVEGAFQQLMMHEFDNYTVLDIAGIDDKLAVLTDENFILIVNSTGSHIEKKIGDIGLEAGGSITAIDGKLVVNKTGKGEIIMIDPETGKLITVLERSMIGENPLINGATLVEGRLAVIKRELDESDTRFYLTVMDFEELKPRKDYTKIKSIGRRELDRDLHLKPREVLPNGNIARVNDENTAISIIDPETSEEIKRLTDLDLKYIHGMTLIDDKLAVVIVDPIHDLGFISIIDPKTGKEITRYGKETDFDLTCPSGIAEIDGKLAVLDFIDGAIIIVNPKTGKEITRYGKETGLDLLCPDSLIVIDGNFVTVEGGSESVIIIDGKTGKEITRYGKGANLEVIEGISRIYLIDGKIAVNSRDHISILEFEDLKQKRYRERIVIRESLDNIDMRVENSSAYLQQNNLFFNQNPGVKRDYLSNLFYLPSNLRDVPQEKLNLYLGFLNYDLLSLIDPERIDEFNEVIGKLSLWEAQRFFVFFSHIDTTELDVLSFNDLFKRWIELYGHLNKPTMQEVRSMFFSSIALNSGFLEEGFDIEAIENDFLRMCYLYLRGDIGKILRVEDREPVSGDVLAEITDVQLEAVNALYNEMPKRVQEVASLEEYADLLEEVEGEDLSDVSEDIHKAIYAQDKSENLFIREAIQNSRDAIIRKRQEGEDIPSRIDVRSYIPRGTNQWVVSIEDPVGMELSTVVGPLLVLDETTKLGSDTMEGILGMGFFTNFADADEVRLTTGIGDGIFYQLEFEKTEQGKWHIKIAKQIQGDYKGTRIERIKNFSKDNMPHLEAMFIDYNIHRYVGAIQDIDIYYDGERINDELELLAGVDTDDGSVNLYRNNSSYQRLTRSLLYVEYPKSEEYFALVPEYYLKLIRANGFTLDIPSEIPLVRTRMTVAQKEKYLPVIQKAVASLCLKAMVRLFVYEGQFPPGLSENYFSDKYGKDAGGVFSGIRQDADNINQDNLQAVDFERYIVNDTDDEATIEQKHRSLKYLITFIEIMDPLGAKVSLRVVKKGIWDAIGSGSEDLEDILRRFNLSKYKGLFPYLDKSVNEIINKKRDAKNPEKVYSDEEVAASKGLRDFKKLSQILLRGMDADGLKVGFYEKEEKVGAFFRAGSINWNLHHYRPYVEQLQDILAGNMDPSKSYEVLRKIMDTIAHEAAHHSHTGKATHESTEELVGLFAWQQKQLIRRFVRSGINWEDILSELRSSDSSEGSISRKAQPGIDYEDSHVIIRGSHHIQDREQCLEWVRGIEEGKVAVVLAMDEEEYNRIVELGIGDLVEIREVVYGEGVDEASLKPYQIYIKDEDQIIELRGIFDTYEEGTDLESVNDILDDLTRETIRNA